MREPLLIPLAAVAAGICLSHVVEFSLPEACVLTLLLTALAFLALRYARHSLTTLCTRSALLAAGIALSTLHRPGPPPEADANSQEVVLLSGCVVEPPVLTADREHFLLELAPRAYASVSLALREGEKAPGLDYGERVEIDAKIRRPRNFGNPGAFDYVRYLARQNIYWTASARAGAPIARLPGRCGSRALALIFALRVAALDRIEQLYAGDPYSIAMMEAILLGESSKLEKVWTEHFRRTGTYHALVISGLHVTVLAGVLLFLLRLCLLPEMMALAIAAIAAWLYAAVSGWSAPVVRAAGGFTLYLCCRYFYRRGRLMNLLAAIGIGYLLYDPGQMFDASFQLSFLSVAAIGAFAVPIMEHTSEPYREASLDILDRARDLRMRPQAAALRVELRLLAETLALWTRLPERYSLRVFALLVRFGLWTFDMVLLSAVIQVALALPMALYFHRISITGLSANLLIVPLLSIVVPVGFGAIFTGWRGLAWAAKLLLAWSEQVANWHAQFEPAMRTADPPAWLAAAFVASLIVTAMQLRIKTRWRWPAAGLTVALFGVILLSPFPAVTTAGSLELTLIDVGQGDSLLVALPDGKLMLVDAGGIPAFGRRTKPRMDIGEDVVSPYLWSRRIERVDVIAVSHAHEDHIGGLRALLENFRPAELWTGATPAAAQWLQLEQHARDLGIRVIHRRAGEETGMGGAAIEVLAPLPDYEAGAAAKNNDSLVLRMTFGGHSFLLTGDMEKQVEGQLAASGVLGKTTVLKVAHHGSKTSSIEPFLAATQPALALISAGFENSFRHPHPDVVERLGEHHAAILRTDQSGLISVFSDGRRLTIETNEWERAGPRGYLPFY